MTTLDEKSTEHRHGLFWLAYLETAGARRRYPFASAGKLLLCLELELHMRKTANHAVLS